MSIVINRTAAPAAKPSGRGSKELQDGIEAAGKFAAAGEWFEWPGMPKSWKPLGKKLAAACPHVEVYQDLNGKVIVKAKATPPMNVPAGPASVLTRMPETASPAMVIPGVEGRILKVLYKAVRRMTVGDIKTELSLTNSPTAAIAELRSKGLVNTADEGAKTVVTLTARGNEAAKLVK